MQRKSLRKISDKKRQQLKAERVLTARLIIKQNGKCANCGRGLGWRSAKHELKSRAQGGNPMDEENCILLCGKCHSARHGIKEVE